MAQKISFVDIIARFNALDVKVRIGIFAFLLLLLLALDYTAVMQFELAVIKSCVESIRKDSDNIAKLDADQARMGQMKNNLKKVREDFNKLKARIRPLQDLPLVIEEVNKMVQESHVAVDQVNALREGQEDFATVGDIKFFAIPVMVTAHTGYHNFGQFLFAMENSNIMFFLKEVKMEGMEKVSAPVNVAATFKIILSEKPMEEGK